MRTFILGHDKVIEEKVAMIAVMKEDWEQLPLDKKLNFIQYAINRQLAQTDKDEVLRFLKDDTAAPISVLLNNYKNRLTKADLGNALEFTFYSTTGGTLRAMQVSTETYNRFLEDAEDELMK